MDCFRGWNIILIDSNHGANWKDRMLMVDSDASIKDILNNTDLFNNNVQKRSFGIFKRGILPAYEDMKNTGRFVVKYRLDVLETILTNFRQSKLYSTENVSGIYINKKKVSHFIEFVR